jgi:hypothetical protein
VRFVPKKSFKHLIRILYTRGCITSFVLLKIITILVRASSKF